jgi:hypothetical protein
MKHKARLRMNRSRKMKMVMLGNYSKTEIEKQIFNDGRL